MAESDDFVRTTLASVLQPGEVILSMGWMAPLTSGWREQYDRYFAAGTTSRLIVIKTSKAMSTIPKLTNEGVTWMDYASMQEAGSRRFSALSDNLVIKGASGELKYCVPAPTIIGAKAMAGHQQFNELYVLWLCRHVATGSFRSPQGAQAAAAEWQDPAALNDANIRFAPKSMAAARRRFQRRIKWPFYLSLVPMTVGVLAGGQKMSHGGRRAEEAGKMWLIAGLGLAVALMILGIVLNIKRRAADAAADRARAAGAPAQ